MINVEIDSERIKKIRSEALAMYNGRAYFLIFFFGNPTGGKCRE